MPNYFPRTPPANMEILLNFDGMWRVGRYLTTAAHFAACMQNPVFDWPGEPRFYCHSDGHERLLHPDKIKGWQRLEHPLATIYYLPIDAKINVE